MLFLLRPLRYVVGVLTEQDAPRQLALGCALGMVIGLVPKGNLTAAVLLVLLSALRVNLAAGMLSALAFSWIGTWLDPLTHRIGMSLLTWDALHPLWTRLYNLPLVPWTDFNNSVVLGSLVLGLALFYPLYRLSLPLWARFTPILRERLLRLKAVQFLRGAELAGRLSGSSS